MTGTLSHERCSTGNISTNRLTAVDLDPMSILNFLGTLVGLPVGALILNFVSQALEGRKTYFLHFGYVTMIVVVGAAVFPFWG